MAAPTPAQGWRPEWDVISRGWANMVCIGAKHFPELVEVFEELQRMPKNANNIWCDLPTVNKLFFSRFKDKDWSWANEALGPPPQGAPAAPRGSSGMAPLPPRPTKPKGG